MLAELLDVVLNLPPLVYAVVGLVTVWYLKTRSNRVPANVPPFPARPYPVVGHFPLLGSDPCDTFRQWRKETGDMFSLYFGGRHVVVMNSFALLKDAFVKKAEYFSDRPMNIVSKQEMKDQTLGIIGNSGPPWKEQRSVSMAILKTFGMGKNWLAEKIDEEVSIYLELLADFKGEPREVRELTNGAVSNVICAILVGQRFELDDPYFTELLRLVNENVFLLRGTTVLNIFPWLRHLPGDLFNAKKVLNNSFNVNRHFSAKFIQEAKDSEADNFVSSYFKQMQEKQKSGNHTYLKEGCLVRVMSNLFAAGSETTSTTISWALLFAVRNPQAQEKFYHEMMEVVGHGRRPSIQDRADMHYVNAFIMEVQRLGSIVPLSLSHECNATVEVAGYTIPKGTIIIPNLDEVLKDPETWGDPLVFRPERFLDKDNKVVVPEEFIPFSIGRRYCMGESLAKMELFLFLTGIFQRFNIRPEDPANLPSTERSFGITSPPKGFCVRFIDRHEEEKH